MVLECPYFKVVTDKLQSLGLRRNPNILTYPVGIWVYLPPDQIIEGKGPWNGFGGIGVFISRGDALGLKKYMERQNQQSCLVYRCDIDRILYEDPRHRRLKTNGVRLIEQI